MKNHFSIRTCASLLGAVFFALALASCETTPTTPGTTVKPGTTPTVTTPTVTTPTVTTPVVKPPTPIASGIIRIKAGEPLTDSTGIKWEGDAKYCEDGTVLDRPDLKVTDTKTPEVYTTERYGMTAYKIKVANGKYTMKLHFSEDYDGNTDPNSRLFTFAIYDGDDKGTKIKEFKSFGPFKLSGAQYKAYVVTEPVTVTKGLITITFTQEVENTQINAIEIIPG